MANEYIVDCSCTVIKYHEVTAEALEDCHRKVSAYLLLVRRDSILTSILESRKIPKKVI